MVIAMVAVQVVQPPVHQEVQVVAVAHLLVPAVFSVRTAADYGVAFRRILRRHLDAALVPVAGMLVMEMSLVQIVDVIPMAELGMPASNAVLMRVILVDRVHRIFPRPTVSGRRLQVAQIAVR